jgi:hypothetical protein
MGMDRFEGFAEFVAARQMALSRIAYLLTVRRRLDLPGAQPGHPVWFMANFVDGSLLALHQQDNLLTLQAIDLQTDQIQTRAAFAAGTELVGVIPPGQG